MNKIIKPILAAAVCLIMSPALALTPAPEGFYLGFETGIGFGSKFSTSSGDNDLPTVCDHYLHPPSGTTPSGNRCANSQGDSWSSDFDSTTGFLSGVAGGYQFGRGLRAEGEYLFSHSSYDQSADVSGTSAQIEDKLERETVESYEHIGSVRAHSVLVNGYYDLILPALGRWTPYAGAGVGISWMRVNYNSVFTRSLDPDNIVSADDAGLTAEELQNFQRAAAGTTTLGQTVLNDAVLVWQLLVGLDYRVNDHLTLGGKARYVGFGEVEDGAAWNQLRSHASNNNPNDPAGSRVRYNINTGEINLWGIGFSLRYSF